MAEETVRINLDFETTGNAPESANKLTRSLQDVEKQANKTREQMQRLSQVGMQLAGVGAAITGPFLLAMKKWYDTASKGDGERKDAIEKISQMQADADKERVKALDKYSDESAKNEAERIKALESINAKIAEAYEVQKKSAEDYESNRKQIASDRRETLADIDAEIEKLKTKGTLNASERDQLRELYIDRKKEEAKYRKLVAENFNKRQAELRAFNQAQFKLAAEKVAVEQAAAAAQQKTEREKMAALQKYNASVRKAAEEQAQAQSSVDPLVERMAAAYALPSPVAG
jgi:hypothetical protein